MTQENLVPPAASARHSNRSSGLLICIGAVLSVFLMAHHPSVQTHTVADAIEQLRDKATVNGLVHGGLLVILAAMFTGFLGFSGFLGWHRLSVRGGAVFYACGVGCMIGAALINGFVVTAIAAAYDGQPDALMETSKSIFVLCHCANQALAQAGTVALSIAMLAWSIELFGRGTPALVIGLVGLLVGALPIAGLLTGLLRLDVRGMMIVILMQAIWSLAAGIWLMGRGASPAQADSAAQ